MCRITLRTEIKKFEKCLFRLPFRAKTFAPSCADSLVIRDLNLKFNGNTGLHALADPNRLSARVPASQAGSPWFRFPVAPWILQPMSGLGVHTAISHLGVEGAV